MKSMAVRGILIGWLAFLVIALAAYVTPARVPVLMLAGRDYAVLRLQLQARQQAVETLQPQGSTLNRAQDRAPALTRARTGTSNVEARMEAWRRLNSAMSPFGFISWLSDLWPWLLGLGFAFPVLGGLIGAQVPKRVRVGGSGSREHKPDTDSQSDSRIWGVRHPPVPEPEPTQLKVSGKTTEIPTSNPPQENDVGESRTLPADPAAWNWSARPAARNAPSRPKPPPVKSPHGNDGE
jgi:hypothetical protein